MRICGTRKLGCFEISSVIQIPMRPFTVLDIVVKRKNRCRWNQTTIFYSTLYGKDFMIRGLPGVETFEDWKKLGFDTHSIIADPLFVDPENDDYSLKPESPAFKLGFKPIDLSRVGLRGTKYQ